MVDWQLSAVPCLVFVVLLLLSQSPVSFLASALLLLLLLLSLLARYSCTHSTQAVNPDGRSGKESEGLVKAYDFEDLVRLSGHSAEVVTQAHTLTRNDFRLAMLLRLGRIKDDDCLVIDAVFDSLDKQGKDEIALQDVVQDLSGTMHRRIEQLDEILGDGAS